ncbi:hypothetical protein SynA1840_02128 [Synechococcus sp. A18-40]|nr:hypothetical protein SynA1840_02128 [Synechococcus sp. A18-40]
MLALAAGVMSVRAPANRAMEEAPAMSAWLNLDMGQNLFGMSQ